jgi:NADPH:quinone reductase-like Zn-dependent oxidoreductase
MRAAVLHELGVPRAGEFREPEPGPGEELVEVSAAGLNPVDVAICSGSFYAGTPPTPCVAGREGVGTLADGRRVYFDSPVAPWGSMAERAPITAGSGFPLPEGVEDGVAVALGIAGLAAWLSLTWRAELQAGEHVLVLGASGIVGQVAVQAAKLLGASSVVAAARSREGLERARARGADATVAIGAVDDLSAALREAAGGQIDVVVDPLFGEPFAAAVEAASFGARLVNLGASAGPQATLSSAAIRGKMLVIMGHTNVLAPPEVKRDAYLQMAAAAARGELEVDVEEFGLERVEDAWARLAESTAKKIVLVP